MQSRLFSGKILVKMLLWPTITALICATAYTISMLTIRHPGKDSWLEEGLYMLTFHAACLAVLLPWFIGMICFNWTRMCDWRWRLFAAALSLAILVATVCIPEVFIRYLDADSLAFI